MPSKLFEREVTIKFKGKRPAYATPELARELIAKGMKPIEIAKAWGIGRTQIYNIIKQQ